MEHRAEQWPVEYRDFVLHLHSVGRDRFGVSASSPAGDGDGEFSASDLPAEWSRASRGCILRDLVRRSPPKRSGLSPAELGTRLYRALFPARVRSLFERSVDLTRSDRAGLRVKIFLSPRDPALRLLQGYPWELLRREDKGEFLALSRWTPVTRSLPVAAPPRAPRFPARVRVLASVASPRDAAALDLQRELAEMKSAAGLGRFEIVPSRATLEDLQTALERDDPFHVLHFLGHGDFREASGEGVLLFEESSGIGAEITGDRLAELLQDFTALQLVVLNACHTARAPLGPSTDPFGGVAAALVQAGFPAVLAMQEPVADKAAIDLSRSLYGHLARGRPLEGALAKARQAVKGPNGGSLAWAIPSLFLRAAPVPSPQDDTDSLVQEGIGLYRSGRHALARQRLREALVHDPEHEGACLFESLARMATGDLSTAAIREIDEALQGLLGASDSGAARLARLALGILRFDAVGPRGVRVGGISSGRLFQELEGVRWTAEEKQLARTLRPSKSVSDLLNLRDR